MESKINIIKNILIKNISADVKKVCVKHQNVHVLKMVQYVMNKANVNAKVVVILYLKLNVYM